MGFFNNITTGSSTIAEAEGLQKALSTGGYGTDASKYIDGRALIPENIEFEVQNVMSELKEDCKIMNSIKPIKVKSNIHQVNMRNNEGEYRHLSVQEGGLSLETSQNIDRKIFDMKYLQTLRGVTRQMEIIDTFENALASEKIAGIDTIMKGAEYLCFHGDSSIIPTEFDGFISSIKKAKKQERNIISLRGESLGKKGEGIFDEIANKIFENGAYIDRAMFPPVLAHDIKNLVWDKLRFILTDKSNPLPPYATACGAVIKLQGESVGADRYYKVKGIVNADGIADERPNPPKSVTAVPATGAAGSQFTDDDKGDFKYTVHAVNAAGISKGTDAAAAATIAAAGSKVTVTITPADTGKEATGFIICRSKKGGDVVMEMDRVKNSGDTTTVYEDLNEELPGTASMLFLTERRVQPVYTFAQLLPMCTYPLYPTNAAVTPFLVMLYGGLELRVPKFCGLVKDIAYSGGL